MASRAGRRQYRSRPNARGREGGQERGMNRRPFGSGRSTSITLDVTPMSLNQAQRGNLRRTAMDTKTAPGLRQRAIDRRRQPARRQQAHL
jgi:hypothetical protein